ncbi:signal peptidase complex subunit 3-like [Anneissia japonica]|uniref:signal peptidase complex subunit 3-like n=1 Tax=Anneissia japonica TaxID=1529436 RepID=UPI0014258DA2|nr:signal peptidase complex subunit 3-like [Anneissia japonica]
MNTVLSRLNTIFAFTLSVMAALTFGCFLTTAFNDNLAPVHIDTFKHSVKQQWQSIPDLKWFMNIRNVLNQVVLWDKIILRGNNALLDYRSIKMKYPFFDDGNGLKGHDNITLSLSWNVIPNAGMLPRIYGDGQTSFSLPIEYSNRQM